MNTKQCVVCNKIISRKYHKYRFTNKQWDNKKYCSLDCYRKVPRSEEVRKKIELNADHIQSFAEHPELRLAIDNGRTLCRECHYKRHSKA